MVDYATQTDVNAGWIDPGEIAKASGWGRLTTFSNSPDHLQSVEVPIVGNNTLDESDYDYEITDNMLSAGANGIGACHGDSGGPLVVRDNNNRPILAGIVSFRSIHGCATTNYSPEIYTRVSRYCGWITENIVTVTGPTTFCPSATFSVNLPPGGTVNWSVSPSSALTFTQGSATSTFTRNGSFNGWATITATLNSSCGALTLTKNVLVEPAIDMTITDVYPGPIMHVSATATGGNAPYEWYINGVLQKTTSTPDVLIRYNCTGVGLSDLEVRSTTSCGVAVHREYFYEDCGYQTTVNPNPASNEITIEEKPDKNTLQNTNSPEQPATARLFDFGGNFIKAIQLDNSGKSRMEVSGLKEGHYFLIINREGEKNETHRVIIAR